MSTEVFVYAAAELRDGDLTLAGRRVKIVAGARISAGERLEPESS